MARYSRLTNGLHCSVFLVGQTLPTALAQRVPDAFAFDFLSACAGAELCFRPDEVQFGYWACDKLSSYLRNGDEPHRGGPSVLAPLHIFDVMDVAYTHPEGGFLSKHVQENPDCQPYRDDHTLLRSVKAVFVISPVLSDAAPGESIEAFTIARLSSFEFVQSAWPSTFIVSFDN